MSRQCQGLSTFQVWVHGSGLHPLRMRDCQTSRWRFERLQMGVAWPSQVVIHSQAGRAYQLHSAPSSMSKLP